MTAEMIAPLAVGLGDLFVAAWGSRGRVGIQGPHDNATIMQAGELVAYSLGSCIAICLYDPFAKVAGMAHVVLPSAPANGTVPTPGKFGDTAVPALLEQMRRQGADRRRMRCKIAGGAAVLTLGGGGSLPNIGQRNAQAVKAALTQAQVRVLAEDTGGNQGRTVRLDVATGRVMVRTVRGTEAEL